MAHICCGAVIQMHRKVDALARQKSDVTLIADNVGKDAAFVRKFINKHPEFCIEKQGNKFVMTDEQREELSSAILSEIAAKEEMRKENSRKHRQSQKDTDTWNEILSYMEYKVLRHDDNQKMSRNDVLRLRGLMYGKRYADNRIEDEAKYSFECLLNTIKYSMPDINRALDRVQFEDENHKFNYVLRIIGGNLNTVYMRMKRAKKKEEEIEKQDTSYAVEYVNMFKAKKVKSNHKLDNLW